jgi:hypothetical protein
MSLTFEKGRFGEVIWLQLLRQHFLGLLPSDVSALSNARAKTFLVPLCAVRTSDKALT